MRGIPKGASPLCVVAEEGVTGEKPHRKGFSSRACFWLLFARAKSNPGFGGEAPEKRDPPKSFREQLRQIIVPDQILHPDFCQDSGYPQVRGIARAIQVFSVLREA